MGQVMEALHRLQAIERQLAEIRRDQDAKARRVQYNKRLVRKAEEKLEESRLTFRNQQRTLEALQHDAGAREESVDRHRQALNKARTNKEYAAILTAMNTEKADNAKLETEILQLMEETQSLEDEAERVETEKAKLHEDVTRTEKVLHAYETQSQPKRDRLDVQRDACAEQIPPTTLNTFMRVAERHDGEALAPVVKLRPKREEYICSGCNITLTLEAINMLQTSDEIQICKVCGRILYLEDPATQRVH